MRTIRLVLLGLCAAALATLTAVLPAQAVQVAQTTLVSQMPSTLPPNISNGSVQSVVQVGYTIIAGGTFTQVVPHGGGSAVTRSYIVAFDVRTGALSTTFLPTISGRVNALEPAADGTSVYVGGQFAKVNGVASRNLTELNVQTGQIVSGFKPAKLNGPVNSIRLSQGHLWIGGTFTKLGTAAQTALATVSPTTGAYDPYMSLQLSGLHNGGHNAIVAMDITPDGSRMVAVGNFTTVGGVASEQIVMLDLTGSSAHLANWHTDLYTGACSSGFDTYMRGVDISPDGSYFVVSTTGAYHGYTSPCDQTSRWNFADTGNVQPVWTDYTGGDTTYAVAITGTAVYTGGHFRWQNNSFAGDKAGQGAVAREGISALDPANGLPLNWSPGRKRGVGVFDMLATSQGLWVASDTSVIAGKNVGRLALMPLDGGQAVPSTATPQLPGQAYVLGAQSASNVLYRVNAAGGTVSSLDNGPAWAGDTSAAPSSFHNSGSNTATYNPRVTFSSSIPAGTPSALFDSERWSPSDNPAMDWSFPVPAGTHVAVDLYFANRCTCTSGAGQRVFNVAIDGTPVLQNYDIVADVGDQTATMKEFDVTSDGSVDIDFSHVKENPLINAIQIVDTDRTSGNPNTSVTRTFDGSTAGDDSTVPSSVQWANARGGFYANGMLYTGWSDGNLYARPFDGTTFGATTNENAMDKIVPLASFHSEVPNITGMFFDSATGRLYYTQAGSSSLYYRYFTPSSAVVGAQEFTEPNNSSVDLSEADGMFLAGGTLYVADGTTGNLDSVGYSAEAGLSGTAQTVSGPSMDGHDWRGHAVFLGPAQ